MFILLAGILDNEGSTREFFVVREATENRRINRTSALEIQIE